jgi:hypothetical protein
MVNGIHLMESERSVRKYYNPGQFGYNCNLRSEVIYQIHETIGPIGVRIRVKNVKITISS